MKEQFVSKITGNDHTMWTGIPAVVQELMGLERGMIVRVTIETIDKEE